MHTETRAEPCLVHEPEAPHARERGVRLVVALTAAMMVVEVGTGYAAGSMALVADGWHMATHVGALGVASLAYALSRRFAGHRAFAFGTGKVHALSGYTSAAALGFVALAMIVESVSRLARPSVIDFGASVPVAVVGLVVNLVSIWLLDVPGDEHHHEGEPYDHNHRAALMHVVADALTSALAVAALLAGRWLGWTWLDPFTGVVGGIVILKWGFDLCRSATSELLDLNPDLSVVEDVRTTLERIDDVRVHDLHVWSMGRGRRSCIVTIVSAVPREVEHYREHLAPLGLTHLTIEVRRCPADNEHRVAMA
jgi:cation diffusion facilitator family transporter